MNHILEKVKDLNMSSPKGNKVDQHVTPYFNIKYNPLNQEGTPAFIGNDSEEENISLSHTSSTTSIESLNKDSFFINSSTADSPFLLIKSDQSELREEWKNQSYVNEVSNDSTNFDQIFPSQNENPIALQILPTTPTAPQTECVHEAGNQYSPIRSRRCIGRRLTRTRQHASRMRKVETLRGLETNYNHTPCESESSIVIRTGYDSSDDLTFLRSKKGKVRLTVCPRGNVRSALRERACTKLGKKGMSKIKTDAFLRGMDFDTNLSKQFSQGTESFRSEWIGGSNKYEKEGQWLQRANAIV